MSIFVKQILTNIENILYHISIFSVIVPFILVLLLRQKTTGHKALAIYFAYSLISDLLLSQASLKYLNSEIYSYRIFTLVEYSLLTFYIWHEVQNVIFKRIIRYSTLLFFFFFIEDIFFGSITDFDSIPTAIESILIMSTLLLLVYERIIKLDNSINPSIWISIGLLLFFSGTFFLFILSKNNFKEIEFSYTYGFIISAFNIVKSLFITIGLISEDHVFFKRHNKFQNR